MKHRRKKIMKSLTLAFAVAVVAAPVAGARPWLGGYNASAQQARDGLNQVGSSSTTYWPQELRTLEARYQSSSSAAYSPQALRALELRSEGMNQRYIQVASSRPDDRAGSRGPGFVKTPVLVSAPSGGFDWNDAGIGAGTALASALILLGSVAVTRRNRQSTVAV